MIQSKNGISYESLIIRECYIEVNKKVENPFEKLISSQSDFKSGMDRVKNP